MWQRFSTMRFIIFMISAISLSNYRTLAAKSSELATVVVTFPQGLPRFVAEKNDGKALVEYGEFLFGSKLLSADNSLACMNCHVQRFAYSDSHPVAVGVDGSIGRRHAPPIFNLFGAKALMLDGRASNLKEQIHIPLESDIEMNVDWSASLKALSSLPETRNFLQGLPRQPELSRDLVLAALAAYVRSLVSGGSAFDRYYYGGQQDAIGDQAKEGLKIFVRKGRCASCHLLTGAAAPLTDYNFHSIGIGFADGKYSDNGRFEVTHDPVDRGAFKTPTLRNVALRPYYMHDGSMKSLREVVDYYNRGGNPGAANVDGRVQKLFLTEEEIEALIAFLQTLNSEIVSYRPQAVTRP